MPAAGAETGDAVANDADRWAGRSVAPGGARLALAAVAGHVAVALALTAPLAWHLGQLPQGREPAETVPRFNLWTLQWTADRLPHGLVGWWDAPIFWPTGGAFAFSEPQPLTGLAFAVVRGLVGAGAAYGLILVGTLALNGVAGAALARRLGTAAVPAFVAGVLAQALPFVFDQLGVLQLVAVWPLFFALDRSIAWIRRPTVGCGALLGLAMAAAVGTCGYYALLLGVTLAVAVPVALVAVGPGAWRAPGRAASAAAGLGVFLLLAGPVLWGQGRRLADHRWADATIRAGSATWSDWAPSGRVWPGPVLLLVGGAGAFVARRARTTWFLLGVAAIAGVLALGARLDLFGVAPWGPLTDAFEPLARLRSPYRAGVLVQVALVGLAAPALQAAWERLPAVVARVAAVLLLLGIIAASPGPGPLVAPPPPGGAWATWLAAHDDGAAVAFLPFAPTGRVASFEPTTARMLQNQRTGHPMVNGYSGFFPADHAELRDQLRGFPDERSFAALRRRQVRYVVIDADRYDAFDARIARSLGGREVARDDEAVVLRIDGR